MSKASYAPPAASPADLANETTARQAGDAARALRFTDRGTKTALYAMAAWDSVTYDLTSGSISQALPSSPATGDEVEYYVSALSGTNTLTVTGTGGPFTISVAGHGAVARWTGSAWVERQDRKTKAALDGSYAALAGPLGKWRAKLFSDPANAKVAFVGDSTSDPTTSAATLFRRLLALHTQQGESLYGVASSDYFTDAATTSASPTLTSATAAFTANDVGRIVHGRNIPQATTITAVTNATTVTMSNNATGTGTGLPLWIGRHVIAAGNSGVRLSDWFTDPSNNTFRYNRDKLVADNPDLIVYSWLLNDIRQGAMGTTVAACYTAGVALIQSLVDWTRTTLPNASILLRMPNPMLTADVSANHFVTDGSTTNPAGQAQIYSTAMRRIYLYFAGRYSNVDVIDIQGELFGAECAASHPLMLDQLHPNANTVSDIYSLTPSGGGYSALADALAKRIGPARNAFVPAGVRVRHEFIVYDAPSANTLRLLSRDVEGLPATQAPVFKADSLYINGASSPIALSSATIDRTFSSTILNITSLTGDWSPYIGQAAVITGTHAPQSTGDRQQIFIDLPSIAAGATVTQAVTVTGATTGQTGSATAVIATPGNGFGASGLFLMGCYPSGTDTVRLVIQNPTGSAIDLSGESWTFWVMR